MPREITEEEYYERLEILPPIYIKTIDDKPVKAGFAIMEPLTFKDGTMVSQICWAEGPNQAESKYFTDEARIYKIDGARINYPESETYTRNNKAVTK